MSNQRIPMKNVYIINGRFSCEGKDYGEVLEGQVSIVEKYFYREGPNGFEELLYCHDESQVPQGWELHYTLEIWREEVTFLLAIDSSIIVSQLTPYISALMANFSNISIGSVETRIAIQQIDGHTFPTFSCITEGLELPPLQITV